MVVTMALALLGSALALVYVQYARRTLFVELQGLERERDELQVNWGRLQLEQSTWATDERIAGIATEKLGLYRPSADQIVLVKP